MIPQGPRSPNADPATRLPVSVVLPVLNEEANIAAAVLLAIIIVTGGAVRLSDSGLGCPQWPNCAEGSLAPREASDANAMIEFVNRVARVAERHDHHPDIDVRYCRVTLQLAPRMVNFQGTPPGGVIFSLADVAFSAACNSHGEPAVALSVAAVCAPFTK